MVSEITKDNFDEFIKSEKVVVDFWAPWCGPCLMMGPIFEELSKELQDVKFGKLNVDENPEVAQKFGVMGIPTLIIFKDGKQTDRVVGVMPKDELKKKITEA